MEKFFFLYTKCFFFIFIFFQALLSVKTEGKLNEHTKDLRAIQIKLEIMYSESLSLVYSSNKDLLLIDFCWNFNWPKKKMNELHLNFFEIIFFCNNSSLLESVKAS